MNTPYYSGYSLYDFITMVVIDHTHCISYSDQVQFGQLKWSLSVDGNHLYALPRPSVVRETTITYKLTVVPPHTYQLQNIHLHGLNS